MDNEMVIVPRARLRSYQCSSDFPQDLYGEGRQTSELRGKLGMSAVVCLVGLSCALGGSL